MVKYTILLAIPCLMFLGCGENVVSGDSIFGTMEKRIYADDVYGIGAYRDRRAEFESATGCTGSLNCTGSMVIREEGTGWCARAGRSRRSSGWSPCSQPCDRVVPDRRDPVAHRTGITISKGDNL